MRLKRKKTHFPHPTLERGSFQVEILAGLPRFFNRDRTAKRPARFKPAMGKALPLRPVLR